VLNWCLLVLHATGYQRCTFPLKACEACRSSAAAGRPRAQGDGRAPQVVCEEPAGAAARACGGLSTLGGTRLTPCLREHALLTALNNCLMMWKVWCAA